MPDNSVTPITACVKQLGIVPYADCLAQMQTFTTNRTPDTGDEFWTVEHPPVYTQGQAGKAEYRLAAHPEIEVVQSDRGGQITYHGPGQLIVYLLCDLRRLEIGVRTLVQKIERAIIATLAHYGLKGEVRCGAPGVYLGSSKICSLGLRVKRGCSYHGLALNVDMEMSPFKGIIPCGLHDIDMTSVALSCPKYNHSRDYPELRTQLLGSLRQQLYN